MNCWWILGASVLVLVTVIVLMLTGVIPVEKKEKKAPTVPAAPLRALPAQPQRRSGEALVRAIQAKPPPYDQVEADRRSMEARKAAALNSSALAREARKRKL